MPSGLQLLVLLSLRDAQCSAPDCQEEAGRGEHLGVIGAPPGLGDRPLETSPAIPLFRLSNYHRDCGAPKSPQIAAFRPAEGSCGALPTAATPVMPPGDGAKHRCDPCRGGGVGTAGDRGEGENRRSRQAYSGRLARMVFGWVPEASSGPVSLQLGEVGSQRPNRFSVCQSREQRHTGPRTPLHLNEGRPRARYDKKEYNKCSQVEYDSC
jgi:hypothetical protein